MNLFKFFFKVFIKMWVVYGMVRGEGNVGFDVIISIVYRFYFFGCKINNLEVILNVIGIKRYIVVLYIFLIY